MARLYKAEDLRSNDMDKEIALESMYEYMQEDGKTREIPHLGEEITTHLTYQAREMDFLPSAQNVEIYCEECEDDLWLDASGRFHPELVVESFDKPRELLEKVYGDKLDAEFYDMLYGNDLSEALPEEIEDVHDIINQLEISFEPDYGAVVRDPTGALDDVDCKADVENKIGEYVEPYEKKLAKEAAEYFEENHTFEKLNEAFERANYGQKALFDDNVRLVGTAYEKQYTLENEMVKRMATEMKEKGGVKAWAAWLAEATKQEGLNPEKMLKGMKELTSEFKARVDKERGTSRG